MLVSNALTTVARLASFMGVSTPTASSADEVKMQASINAVTAYIERYTGITFKQTTYTNEEYSTERGQTLNLKHYPVDLSETFTLQRRNSQLNESEWETIDTDFYTVDYEAGIIMAMDGIYFSRGRNNYRVTYTAGYDFDNSTTFLGDTEAADIEIAVWLIAQDLQNNMSSNNTIKSERIGDYSVTYADVSKSVFDNPQAKTILDTYKDLGNGDTMSVLTPLQSI